MSVTANLTTNVETITATIVVEDETIIVQVSAAARGPAGEAGATGPAGPNTLTTATTTNLTGFISGNGTNISGATAAATTATANTLVLRDGSGGASFGPLSALAGSSNQHSITSSAGTSIVGPLALSGSTGDTLTATYNAAITLNSTTGVNVNGGPLSLTQTWNDAAVTYTGLQVNVTDTASNAASLLMDLQADGLSKFRVKTQPSTGPNSFGFLWEADTNGGVFSINAAGNAATLGASTNHDISLSNGQVYVFRSAVGGGLRIGSAALSPRLHSDSDHTLAQRNGTAAQESRIYGTYTGPGNYRRLALKMSSAGVAQIVAEGGGSGALGNRIEIDGLRIGKGGSDVATNTALGASALNANTTGGNNSAVGYFALLNNTTGNSNSAVGFTALRNNTTGGFNVAVGTSAIFTNTTGGNNSALGYEALRGNTTGGNNSAVGFSSLLSNTTGNGNSAVGFASLFSNTTGGSNSAVGFNAGRRIADGSTANAITNNSVYLGADTKALASNQTNQIVIGHDATGLGSNTAVLGNDSIVTTALKGNVGIGTTSPAERLDVVGNIKASGSITGGDCVLSGKLELNTVTRVSFGPQTSGNPMLVRRGDALLGCRTGTNASDASFSCSNLTASGTIKTGGYTFDALPTPTTGMRAYITDGADIPLFMANAAGGGSTVTPVFYNGTNWINA
jgi:hypothetical protein